MLFPDTIEVAAGLVFVYLFMSVLATIAREAWEGFVKSRSRTLERGLIELLCDTAPDARDKKGGIFASNGDRHTRFEILKEFYDHPLIMSLYRGRYTPPSKRSSFTQARQLPSYIPSGHFAFAVFDLLGRKGGQTRTGTLDADEILKAAEAMPNSRLAQIAQFAIHNSGGDLEQARQFLETWYNATMDRVSGWYKHETQTIIFWVSLVACVILNVNTVVIADSLYRDPTLRKVAVTKAEAYINQKATIPASDDVKSANPVPVVAAPPPIVPADQAATPKTVESPAVTDTPPAAATDATPTVDAVPVPPVVSQGPVQSDTSSIATKLVKDVENVKDRRDALADIGLPLGWNSQTLTTMRRLFSFQTKPAEPVKVFDDTSVDNSKPRGLFPDFARWFSNVSASFKTFVNDTVSYYNGQPMLGDALLINAVTAISLIGGWVMTALAVTLGAPFWFDVLSKLMIVRSTIKPKDGSPNGKSGLDGLGALAGALAMSNPAYSGYTPKLVARPASDNRAVAGKAATSVPVTAQDDDLLFLRGLDPYDRPRED